MTTEIAIGRPTACVSLRQQGSAWPARVGCTHGGGRRSGRAAFVSMMKPTDLGDRHDGAVAGRRDQTRNRRVLVQRQVSAGPFVVRTEGAISGLTMTSVVRHPVSTRESTTQSQRSACASRTRRGRERCSTCSWCRKASTSSWRAARDRAHVRRVKRSATSTDIIARAYPSPAATSTAATRMDYSVGTGRGASRQAMSQWADYTRAWLIERPPLFDHARAFDGLFMPRV